jgi:hypothetical protein
MAISVSHKALTCTGFRSDFIFSFSSTMLFHITNAIVKKMKLLPLNSAVYISPQVLVFSL